MSDPAKLASALENLSHKILLVKDQINQRFVGQKDVVNQTLSAIFAGGHILLVGVPGLGKTRLVDTVATVLGLQMSRIQFTPDLMPSDILGSELLDIDDVGRRHFRFQRGPIFCQVLMADEINRASPRTQSALLQAMQERQVSIAGETHDLGAPFHVLATQNPIEHEGTYPLPEAQLDRFLFRIDVPYPDLATERDIVTMTTSVVEPIVRPILDPLSLLEAQTTIKHLPVGQELLDVVLSFVRACRPNSPDAHPLAQEHFAWGPGPRAAQAFVMGIRAHAVLMGRLAPTWADVITLAPSVLGHRVSLRFGAQAAGINAGQIIMQIAADVKGMGRAA